MTAKLVISEHDQLGGLLDDDHTQYLLVNGSRALGGDWSLGGFNLTEVDELRGAGDIIARPSGDTDDGLAIRTASNEQYLVPTNTARRLILGNNSGLQAVFAANGMDDSRGSLNLFPLGNAGSPYATAPAQPGIIQWDSIIESGVAAGLATFGGALNLIGTYRQQNNGFAFNNGLVFNHATTYENLSGSAANFGPVFTLVDQPLIRSTGGARQITQYNSVRAQPRFGPSTGGGTLSLTVECCLFKSAGTVAAGSTIANWYCLQAAGPALGGGAITNWVGLDIRTPTAVVPSVSVGIRTDAAFDDGSGRTFINHQGTAVSRFAGRIYMENGVPLVLGTLLNNGVQLLRSAAGTMQIQGLNGTNNEGLQIDFDPATANTIDLSSHTGAGLGLNLPAIVLGVGSADPTSNWQLLLAPGAKTVSVGGDFARTLFSASANVTLDAAMSNVATFLINDPACVLGTGSAVNVGNVIIQTAPSIGTNRYGLLITSNPTGGTLNYAFRQSNASARARFDGRLDINRGVALGGGATATLGTIGVSGPTVAAQAQWLEIDINGVPHWLPVWT